MKYYIWISNDAAGIGKNGEYGCYNLFITKGRGKKIIMISRSQKNIKKISPLKYTWHKMTGNANILCEESDIKDKCIGELSEEDYFLISI